MTLVRRGWTKREDRYVQSHYGKRSAVAIAQTLHRSASSVRNRAQQAGIMRPQLKIKPEWEAELRRLNGDGVSDEDIAKQFGMERHRLSRWRRKLGLPCNAYNHRHADKIRALATSQCEANGVANLAELRSLVFRQRAAAAGWPDDMRVRQVEIMNLLYDRGPMTRRQLVEAMGMRWLGSRKSLRCNDKGGSYLAVLMRRGLVVCLGRLNKGKGKGVSHCVYALPLWLERNEEI